MMPDAVAEAYGVKCYNCLTGFKFIAKIIRENEGIAQYIGGGEESFGYLGGDYVRDKDGVSACSLAAEAAAWAKSIGTTLYGLIKELYVEFGFYKEGLVSVVRKGQEGAAEIKQMMVDYRNNAPKQICGSDIVTIKDYQSGLALDVKSGTTTPMDIDKSNVLQYLTADGTILSIRPSGTEPKIKFYFGVKEPLASVADFDKVSAQLDAKIEQMKEELHLK
jgi:phosphoglucomutase